MQTPASFKVLKNKKSYRTGLVNLNEGRMVYENKWNREDFVLFEQIQITLPIIALRAASRAKSSHRRRE